MGKTMISLLKKILIDNWLRKLIALIIAIVIWFAVDHTLTTTKTVNNVSVRIINIPPGKTVAGLQSSGLLNKRLALTMTGKKAFLEEVTPNDIEIVLDASSVTDEWFVAIDKRHLISLNQELSIQNHINKVIPKNLIIKLVPLSTEKISVYVTQPIGEPPKGYQYIDVWPYHLNLTVEGPEETIKKLKSRGLKLTFNMNEIVGSDLERLASKRKGDVISYYIPEDWKRINLPALSEQSLTIDDPDAKLLRIDFIRSDAIPIKFNIPINLFVTPNFAHIANPSAITINPGELVKNLKGIKILNKQLYARGVSELFVRAIEDMMAISINLAPNSGKNELDWSVQFINPPLLEDRYINFMIKEASDDELKDMHPRLRQEYLRNRFRNYMNRLQLFTDEDKLLDLNIELTGKEINLKEPCPIASS
jgi:hypothetical protein